MERFLCDMNLRAVLSCVSVVSACVSGGTTESFFTRNERLDNRRVCDTVLNASTSVPLDQCARLCHNNSSCLSLVYNMKDGKCELFSRIHFDLDDIYSEAGNVNFWKRNDEGLCDIPTTMVNGQVININGQAIGSKAEFVCDDFHIPTTEVIVCDTSGTWVGRDTACQYKSSAPYSMPAEARIQLGSCMILIATPIADTLFIIRLKEDAQNIILNIGFRFNAAINQQFGRNTMINGTWGLRESNFNYWPLVVNQEFNLTICAEETKFRGYIDSTEMFTYVYRLPVSAITTIDLSGAIVMRNIQFLNSAGHEC